MASRAESMIPQSPDGEGRQANTVVISILAVLAIWIGYTCYRGAFAGGPNGNTFGTDFGMFYVAAQVVHHGGDPYLQSALVHQTALTFTRHHIDVRPRNLIHAGEMPLLFWALQPLTALPFQTAALLWMGAMELLLAAGFLGLLRFFGWRVQLVPTAIFLAMPPAFYAVFAGTADAVEFAAFSLALLLIRRHPGMAGAVLAAAWLKPPVALPLVGVILLFHAPSFRRSFVGWLAGTGVLAVLTVATTGITSIEHWIRLFFTYSGDMTIQPDTAPIIGLYSVLVGPTVRYGLEVGIFLVAVACTLLALRFRGARPAPAFLAFGWLWFIWFLAAPYGHVHDEILLTAPIMALMGRDGCRLPSRLRLLSQRSGSGVGYVAPLLVLYLMFFSIVGLVRFPIQVASFPLIGVAICFAVIARRCLTTWGESVRGRAVAPSALPTGSTS